MNRLLLVCTAFAFSASAASAAQVTLDSVGGTWSILDTVGDPVVTGVGTNQINWGREFFEDEGTSGFRFDGSADSGPFETGELFEVGLFTHLNKVIFEGEMVSLARLNLSVTATFDDLVTRTFDTFYEFSLLETPNLQEPNCSIGNGLENFVEGTANQAGCSDHVQIVRNDSVNTEFTFGTMTYTFDLFGFAEGTEYFTVERQDNSTPLLARFLVENNVDVPDIYDDDKGPRPPSPPDGPPNDPPVDVPVIPLPAAFWMLLAGVMGLAGLKRRQA